MYSNTLGIACSSVFVMYSNTLGIAYSSVPYSGLLLRGPKFCESVKIAPAEIFAIAKFASQSGVGSREL